MSTVECNVYFARNGLRIELVIFFSKSYSRTVARLTHIMANASNKKIAALNKGTLQQLYRITGLVYISTFLYFLASHRNILRELIFAVPGLVALYWLRDVCSPVYDSNNQLVKAGFYINQGGTIEYIKDILFLNWGLLLFSVGYGPKAYFGWFIVPIYAFYKGISLFRKGRQMFAKPQQ